MSSCKSSSATPHKILSIRLSNFNKKPVSVLSWKSLHVLPFLLFLLSPLYFLLVGILFLSPFPFSSSCFGPIVSRRSDRWYANRQYCAWPTKYKLAPYYTGCANKGSMEEEEVEEEEEQEEEKKEDEKRMMEVVVKRKGRKGEREGECRESVLSEFLAPSNQGDQDKGSLLASCCYRCFSNAAPLHPFLTPHYYSNSAASRDIPEDAKG